MSHHPHSTGISRKRKEREPFYSFKPSVPVKSSIYAGPKSTSSPDYSNQLLAGYMAYEFLTKGTLFGQKFDPARAEATPIIGSLAEPKKQVMQKPEPKLQKEKQSYDEVASILKNDRAHIPGIVNPTQLGEWIEM
ncbi:hypothetical protein PTKIN_Ptkin10aG0036500 [Pterospermum kingtungense]